jgi:signal transduction histidine kinase
VETQFRLLRYFSIVSLVATVIVAAVLGTFYRHVALRDLTEMAESRNVALTEAFSNSIWLHFAPFLTSASELNVDELRAHPQTAKLYQAVLRQMRGLEVLKVKVYNMEGLTVFSTQGSQTGEDKSNNSGFLAAQSGKVASLLTHRGEIDTFEGKIENRDVISSYVPIRPGGPESPIKGVFELYYDVTALSQRMKRTQGIIVAGVILILSSFYGALFLIVRRADRLIKQQQMQSKQYLEKLEAEITERKWAEEELKRSRLQLRHLANHLQTALEDERNRIASELHENLGQTLVALKMHLSSLSSELASSSLLERADWISRLGDTAIQSVKRISSELRPEMLDDFGLAETIKYHLQEFQKQTGIRCNLTFQEQDLRLSQSSSRSIFRVFQEVLTNVVNHAKATKVDVTLREEAGNLILEARDNGKGITESEISGPMSFGLSGIRQYVFRLKGVLNISGIKGKGTTISIRVPLDKSGSS